MSEAYIVIGKEGNWLYTRNPFNKTVIFRGSAKACLNILDIYYSYAYGDTRGV